MSPQLKEAMRRLGFSGMAMIVGVPATLLCVVAGWGGTALLLVLLLIVPALRLTLKGLRHARRHSLWSLRNRLLVVYTLLGGLPVLLFVILTGLSLWALMSELAVYLAGDALDRFCGSVNGAVEVLKSYPADRRASVAPEVFRPFHASMPGFRLYVRDQAGEHRYPTDAPNLSVDPSWRSVHGLVVFDDSFYAWSHWVGDGEQIDALAKIDEGVMQTLVPRLGAISLFEKKDPADRPRGKQAFAGNVTLSDIAGSHPKAGMQVKISDTQEALVPLPAPMFRFDVPVFTPATRPHYHLDTPGKSFQGVLMVLSRPSAVFHSLFSGSESVRDTLADALAAIGILFLLVESVAIWIGVSLSLKITRAVNQLYEGTRRVIRGDFKHRIALGDSDQLGELAQSFNQMTGNLERLMVVEKEKERLQTELEIAREVQGQLYPKAAPPVYGLRLTVRCEPARMVSGDYYDYLDMGSGKLVFALGDVAGKGISAALLMATIQAALRAQMTSYTPVHENDCSHRPEVNAAGLVSRLNKQIYAHTSPEKYATFFFAVFDVQASSLTYTNAGHLSPLLFRNGGVTPLDSNGTVVGAFPMAKYDESCLILQPNDLLVCYTDGITEPENAYGEMFGEERLIELVQRYKDRDDVELLDRILEAVRAWTGDPELSDDMTLLLARQVGSGV